MWCVGAPWLNCNSEYTIEVTQLGSLEDPFGIILVRLGGLESTMPLFWSTEPLRIVCHRGFGTSLLRRVCHLGNCCLQRALDCGDAFVPDCAKRRRQMGTR